MPPKENPFRHLGQWYWSDEHNQTHGPFATQLDSLRDLLQHLSPDLKPQSLGSFVGRLLVEIPLIMIACGITLLLVHWIVGQ